jgi:replicative DNA helicase
MIVIAARPSMGKTSLAMNIAEAVAIDQKLPVGVFSLEMTAESLVLRMLLLALTGVTCENIRDGFLAERDFPKLTGSAGKLANARFLLTTRRAFRSCNCARRPAGMAQQYGIKRFRD